MAVKGPLRKVIEEWWLPGSTVKKERLECGHVINAPSDFHGPTNAYRRRCWKCGKGFPPDPT
jgi:hypothetical protein